MSSSLLTRGGLRAVFVGFATLAWAVKVFPQGSQAVPVAKLAASDWAQDDEFGLSVSISGGRALVGAHNKNTTAGLVAGQCYIFESQGDGSWIEKAKLNASDGAIADLFGSAISLSGDFAVVGAIGDDPAMLLTNAGAAYVFERQASGTWSQVQKLVASDAASSDGFGTSVAVDGDRAVVGCQNDDTPLGSNTGSAYVFERQAGGVWVEVAHLKALDGASNDNFGISVSISGTRAIVGSYRHNNGTPSDAGAAYVYERQGDGTWPQVAKLSANDLTTGDQFGYAVDIDGDRVLVGALNDDAGNQNTGSAYVFERQGGGSWPQVAKLVSSAPGFNHYLGSSVSLDGDRALAGAPGAPSIVNGTGAAYLFERQVNGTWSQAAKFSPAGAAVGDGFGISVSLDGELALGGAHMDDNGPAVDVGSAWVFRLCDGCLDAYGTGTPGCLGTQTLGANSPPAIGNASFAFTCDNAPPSSLGLGLVTDSQDLTGSDPFAIGVLLHADLFFATEVISLDFVSDAAGQALAPVAIPNTPPLVGSDYYACALWGWSSCPLPPFQLSSSRGLALTILAP